VFCESVLIWRSMLLAEPSGMEDGFFDVPISWLDGTEVGV